PPSVRGAVHLAVLVSWPPISERAPRSSSPASSPKGKPSFAGYTISIEDMNALSTSLAGSEPISHALAWRATHRDPGDYSDPQGADKQGTDTVARARRHRLRQLERGRSHTGAYRPRRLGALSSSEAR